MRALGVSTLKVKSLTQKLNSYKKFKALSQEQASVLLSTDGLSGPTTTRNYGLFQKGSSQSC